MKTGMNTRTMWLWLSAGWWLCGFPMAGRAADAGSPASREHSAAQRTRSFNDALTEIAARWHIAIVAEGIPLQVSLPDVPAAAPSNSTKSVDEDVHKLVSVFDYDCQRDGEVFALSKRYTEPTDLPSMTMGEWAWVLREVKRLTDPFNPRVRSKAPYPGGRDPIVGDLAASFTAGQIAALSGNGVSLRSMAPAQIALVRRFALNFYVEARVRPVDAVLDWLGKASGDVVFRYQDAPAAKRVFGYDDHSGPANGQCFSSLSGPDAGSDNFWERNIFNAPNPTPDPTDPGDSALDSPYPVDFTLGGLAERLTAAGKGRVNIEVDPSLRTKAITVAGLENAAPQAVMAAATGIYGLSLSASMAGGKRVIRCGFPADPPVPPYAAGLHDALAQVIPRPLVRAFHVEDVINTLLPLSRLPYRSYGLGSPPDPTPVAARPPWEDETLPELWLATQDRVNATRIAELIPQGDAVRRQSDAVPHALKILAIRRFRALVEPRVKASPGEHLPFSSLNEQERDAFATVIASECFSGFKSLCFSAPWYISNFYRVTLTGGLSTDSDGSQTIGLFFTYPRPDGRMDIRGDGIGTRYVK